MSLILKRALGSDDQDYHVFTGQFRIGRIYFAANIADGKPWSWFLNGIQGNAGSVVNLSGRAASLDEAKAELAATFRKWLAWAGLAERE